MLIDVAISADRNVIKKEVDKILKYKDLTIEIQLLGLFQSHSENTWATYQENIKSRNSRIQPFWALHTWSLYRPGVAQRVGRGIPLLFHDRGTSRKWVVSSTPRPDFTPGKDPVTILQEAGWAPGPVWTGGKSRPYRDLILDPTASSQSLYRLSYPANDTSESTNVKVQ
jgi:hypothetical protein